MKSHTTEAAHGASMGTSPKRQPPLQGDSSIRSSNGMRRSSYFGVDSTANNANHSIQALKIAGKKTAPLSKNPAHRYEDPTAQQHRPTSQWIQPCSPPSLACDKLTDFTLDIYSQQWVRITSEETRELEFAFRFRRCVDKVNSPFASTRKEGLYEGLGILIDFTTQTSTRLANAPSRGSPMKTTMTSQSNRRSANPNPNHSNPGRLSSSERQESGGVQIQPFDAISFSNLVPNAIFSGKDREGEGGFENSALHVLHEEEGKAARLWTHGQRALSAMNLTSALFHRILLPRTEVRARVGLRELVEVVLTEDEALRWTSIENSSHSRNTPNDISTASPGGNHGRNRLSALLTGVSFEEQELALRLCQGMYLLIHYQRRYIAEGCFMHYATEVFQCFLQHVECVFQKQRRCLLRQHQEGETGKETGAGMAAGERCLGPEKGNPPRRTNGPVDVNPAQVRVIIALIDAVEAACHYNPPVLIRLVQTGCIKALLNLVYSPCVPVEIRASVLDTISVLLKEVAPFRLSAAAREAQRNKGASPSSSTMNQQQPAASTSRDGALPGGEGKSLLNVMIEQGTSGEANQAFFDSYIGSTLAYNLGGGNSNGMKQQPSSFYMDRTTASRFDFAVREWFSHHGLSHTISGVMELRNFQPPTEGPKMELDRTQRRAKQVQESKLMRLLQMIDGKRAEEREN